MPSALIRKLFSDVRASYWFVPGCLVVLAILAATGSLAIDTSADMSRVLTAGPFPALDVEGMRTVLSVIAQSVIGVAGVMFSITMVAVAHASGQFGPRLIGNFMRDRGNQWSLGILIATFVYTLIVLRSVGAIDAADAFAPHFSLLVALILGFLSVCTVIYYVHHVPETINVANISASLGRRLIARLEASGKAAVARDPEPSGANRTEISAGGAGYLQHVELGELTGVAERLDIRIWLRVGPGDYVTPATCVAVVAGAHSGDQDMIRACFALGTERTEDQDLTFLIDQQVEMIARALSPGINDPQTAMNCLNWCASALVVADRAGQDFGLGCTARVVTNPIGWQDLLEMSFAASWDYVRDDRLVTRLWTSLLDDLATSVGPGNAVALADFRKRMAEQADGR